MMKTTELEKMIREVLSVPFFIPVNITERSALCEEDLSVNSNHEIYTDIRISEGKASSLFTLEKPASEITGDDILHLKELVEDGLSGSGFFRNSIAKLFGWWVIFAGSLTLFSVCPICGSVGCPVGIGITGIFAGVLALVKQYGRYVVSTIRSRFLSVLQKN